jgi:LCP family protein required for cell wall assembly
VSRDRLEREVSATMDETRVFQRSDMPRPQGRWPRILGYALLALVLFSAGLIFGFYQQVTAPSELEMELGKDLTGRINVLVLGVDAGVNGQRTNEWTRSDVNMVVSVDPITKDAAVVSIPRDTRVFIPGKIAAYSKMGHAHAYGGPALAIETVEQFLDIEIDYYVRVDFEAFKQAVDALGGVDMDIPVEGEYSDPAQNLYIKLEKGPAHLDGEKALELVRYRGYGNADIGRIEMQDLFLRALAKKASSLSNVLKIPSLYQRLEPYFRTDLTLQEVAKLGEIGRGIDPDSVKMAMVPGTDRYLEENGMEISYWVPDGAGTEKMVNDLIKGMSRERNAAVKIAIENGNGIPGAADALATILRDLGFQVVSVGNANKQDYEDTRVVARGSDEIPQALALRGVRKICPSAKAYNGSSIPEGADVLIIVGKDYKRPL